MFKKVGVAVLALGVLLAAGCSPKAPSPTIHESMTDVVAPQAQTIWDITNRSYNEAGTGFDPAKISPADWIKLENAARQLGARARLIARSRNYVAAAPGVKIMGEGDPDAPTAKQVQAFIDANPAGLAEHARDLAKAAETVEKAAKTKDLAPLYQVASGLDEVCDGCHEKYWGSDEPPPAALARIRAANK